MLLITRRNDEAVIINGNIAVRVVEIRGNRVKLGFDYPEGNTVYREELYRKIQEANKSALNMNTTQLGDVLSRLAQPKNSITPENEDDK